MAYSSGIQALWNPGALQAHFLYTENGNIIMITFKCSFHFPPHLCAYQLASSFIVNCTQ